MDNGTGTGAAAPVQTPAAPQPDNSAALAQIGSAMQQSAPPVTGLGAPQQEQPAAVNPSTPHAGLLNIVQNIALGLDAFGKAAATHGREGGIEEVQQYRAQQQQQQIQKQQAEQEQQEHDLRMKTMNAQLLMNQLQYQHALMRLPIEEKNDQLALQNATIDEFVKEKSTGESMGYDMADPTQAQEAEQRMGVGSADQQPGALKIPFAAGQNTEDVMKALQSALPPGASLTDYKILPSYNDGKHGTGGEIIAVPNNAPLMQMPATPRQIAASEAEVEGMIEKGKALDLGDNPAFTQLAANFDNMKKVLDAGGKPTTSQLFQMHQSVMGPLAKLVADTTDAAKLSQLELSKPIPGTVNGTPTYGIYDRPNKVWRDSNGNVLTNFQPAPSYAQIAESITNQKLQAETKSIVGPDGIAHDYAYNPQTKQYDRDQGVSGSGQQGSRLFAAGISKLAGEQLITDIENNRDQLGTIEAWVKQKGLNVPYVGDPNAAKLYAELVSFAALQPAQHGFRSTSALETFEKVVGGLQKNPDATIATIRGINATTGAALPTSAPGQKPNAPANNTPTMIRARDPQGHLHQAPAGTPLPKGWTLENGTAAK